MKDERGYGAGRGGAMSGNDGEIALQVANAAMMKMESHEELCGERYGQIVKNQERSESDRREMRSAIETGQATLRAAISSGHEKIYGLMWRMMFSMIATLVTVAGALGLILLSYIQNGIHP